MHFLSSLCYKGKCTEGLSWELAPRPLAPSLVTFQPSCGLAAVCYNIAGEESVTVGGFMESGFILTSDTATGIIVWNKRFDSELKRRTSLTLAQFRILDSLSQHSCPLSVGA